eukprot:9628771-Alexandrium_andersonii.AAC.1
MQAKAPPPCILPGLQIHDAVRLSRVPAAPVLGAVPGVSSPPPAPASGSTVSSTERRGGVPG